MTYRAGDSLAVRPVNPAGLVARVLHRFNLAGDDHLVIHAGQPLAHLPAGQPVGVGERPGHCAELAQPATRRQVETLVDANRCPPEKRLLETLLATHDAEVPGKRVSVLELLKRGPGRELSFADGLGRRTVTAPPPLTAGFKLPRMFVRPRTTGERGRLWRWLKVWGRAVRAR